MSERRALFQHDGLPVRVADAAEPHVAWRWARRGGIVGALVALIALAPARWLASAVGHLTQHRLQWLDAEGTVWQGSARWVLQPANAHPGAPAGLALPDRVQWRVRPQGPAGLSIALRAACCMAQPLQLLAQPVWSGVALTVVDGRSDWPLSWLPGLGAPWNTLQPQGRLHVQTEGLRWRWQAGRGHLDGLARLDLREVGTRLSTLRPLGDYRVEVRGGDTIQFTLSTLDGALRLTGQGQWRERLDFSGEASSDPEHEATLSNLLSVLGQRQGARATLKIGSGT